MRSKIFNTDQVRVIQEGRMTQFMQMVKPQPGVHAEFCRYDVIGQALFTDNTVVSCPFGKAGDVVYCRENWAVSCSGQFAYMADGGLPPKIIHETANECGGEDDITWCWFPSATMPREAARLFLRITNIRVMRVQELTEADMIAQGITNRGILGYSAYGIDQSETAQEAFIYKEGKAKWDENKFQWIIDFAKTDKP